MVKKEKEKREGMNGERNGGREAFRQRNQRKKKKEKVGEERERGKSKREK